MMDDYLNNRDNPQHIRNTHKDLEKFLGETHGIMLFQEQLMQMSMTIAGFSASQADTLRKGVGKKKPEILAELNGDFIAGARQNKYSVKVAERMFHLIEAAGNYGFNRSHAVAYAIIAYQTAYMKKYYPVEFMTALLNAEKDADKLQKYFSEARRMGIEVLPLDINQSDYHHFSYANRIRPGMKIIKSVGETACNTIFKERKNGAFKSIEDFLIRYSPTKVNSNILKNMIAVGVFDKLDFTRQQLLEQGTKKLKICECADKMKKTKAMEKRSQEVLFDMATVTHVNLDLDPDLGEYPEYTLRALELEHLGFYLNDPLYEMVNEIRENTLTTIEEIERHKDEGWIKAVGIVEDPRVFKYTNKKTREFQQGCRFNLKTLDDNIPVAIFGNQYSRAWSLIEQGNVILISGKHNRYNDVVGLIANSVAPADKERVIA
jgi:DNA polymerase-3 subunit alpha